MPQVLRVVFVTVGCCGTVFAAPSGRPLDGFIHHVADETGRSERDIRDEAVDALREVRGVSDTELKRIGRDKSLDAVREIEIVDVLKNSARFKERAESGTADIAAIVARAGQAFESMKQDKPAGQAVTLPQDVQNRFVTALLQDKMPSVYNMVEGDFELRSVARDFPPYGWNYMGHVMIDGKQVDLTEPALIKAIFDAGWGTKPARVRVLRGHLKAESVAREVPPYGRELRLEVVLTPQASN